MMTWQAVADWQRLPGVLAERPDPYVLWANLTDWTDLGGTTATPPLIVELKTHATAKALDKALRDLGYADMIAEPYLNPRGEIKGGFLTLRVTLEVLALLASDTTVSRLIERFDLCAPIRPSQASTSPAFRLGALSFEGKVLFGVIDAGCPFMHPALTAPPAAGRPPMPRLARLWSMDDAGPFPRADTGVYQWHPLMDYGHEIDRATIGDKQGLADWLAARRQYDESTVYELAEYTRLRKRATHGSHVLDLLLGVRPLRSRMPVDEKGRRLDPDRPPTWAVAGSDDVAANPGRSDLIFVELPQAAIDDSSGGWLGAHMLDAVTWIAENGKTAKRVIVTMSYGSTVGPHDGSSIFEAALTRRLESDDKLEVVVAAGNSFSARLHAVLNDARRTLRWRVPPGSRRPAFMQLWCRGVPDAAAEIRVTAPGGAAVTVALGSVHCLQTAHGDAAVASFLERSSRGHDAMALIALSPTAPEWDVQGPAARGLAPAGDWKIELVGDFRDDVDVYVARNDRDLNAPAYGRASWIADEKDEPSRHLRGCRDDVNQVDDRNERNDEIDRDADRAGAVIQRRGTLNGIATARHDRLHVAAGYQLRTTDHNGYSSAGGGRSRLPTAAMVTDESASLRGVRAGGVRGASVVRLVGTSAAAPLLARYLAFDPKRQPPSSPLPAPGAPRRNEELFGGTSGQDNRLGASKTNDS